MTVSVSPARLLFQRHLHNFAISLAPLVRAEHGVQAFYITARKDDPNTFVFYEIYRSQAALDFHLQQDFTKKFVATLKSAQFGDRVQTNLAELAASSSS
jgi:quinol monooxygenase YgiN